MLALLLAAQLSVQDKIALEATRQGIDPKLAIAVATVESGLRQSARGAAGEIGIFQLHPRYFDPAISKNVDDNIRLGVAHLAYWKANCPVKEKKTWVHCYNAGFRAPKFPFQIPYYKKVMGAMR